MDKKIFSIVSALLFFAALPGLFAQQTTTQKIDSLEQVLAARNVPTNELPELYEALSLEYVETDHERAVLYCREGIAIAERLSKWRSAGELYKIMGYAYFCRNQYDAALICFDNMLEVAERVSNKEDRDYLVIKAYLHKGIVSNAKGHLHEEIDNYLKALKIAENIDDKNNMQQLYGNIASAYFALDNDVMAETYFTKGEAICIALNDSLELYYHLAGLSNINCRQQNYEKALEQATLAYQIIQNHQAKIVDQFFVLLTLANIYVGIKDNDGAWDYANNALQTAETLNSSLYLCWALEAISFVELNRGRYAESEQSALRAMEADSSDMVTNVKLFEYLTKANIMLGNKEKADEYLNRLLSLTRELSNKNYQTSLSEMEVIHETEKKEMRVVLLEEERRLMTRLSFAIGFTLLSGLIALFFLWRLTVQKRRFAEQQVIRLQQEKQLIATQAVLDGEVQERARLARDLHDGLGSILAATKYNLADIRKTAALEDVAMDCYDKAMGLLDESMQEMRRIAHHLMPESLVNAGLKQSVADFCNSIPIVDFSFYGDESRFDPKMEIMVYRIIHELVSNALKHASASQILVQIIQEPNRIALTVQDNGCGFDPATASAGMGLNNIRTRITAYNGNLMVDSKPGTGTEINVDLGM